MSKGSLIEASCWFGAFRLLFVFPSLIHSRLFSVNFRVFVCVSEYLEHQ